jgi:hypothetical protein
MTGLPLVQLVGVGMPPSVDSQEPLGFFDGFVLIVVIALVFWLSVRLVTWIEARVELWELLREIRREHGKDRR